VAKKLGSSPMLAIYSAISRAYCHVVIPRSWPQWGKEESPTPPIEKNAGRKRVVTGIFSYLIAIILTPAGRNFASFGPNACIVRP